MRETARVLKRLKDDPQFRIEEVHSSLAPFYSASDIDPNIIEYIESTVTELGVAPTGCGEVLEMSEAGVTQDQLRRYRAITNATSLRRRQGKVNGSS
ncbi:MAG: hypothetical protein AAGK71_06035 [Pseudomonadota bacterium]